MAIRDWRPEDQRISDEMGRQRLVTEDESIMIVWVARATNCSVNPVVVFGPEHPGPWVEFWCEETGHSLHKTVMRILEVAPARARTIHKINSLRN